MSGSNKSWGTRRVYKLLQRDAGNEVSVVGMGQRKRVVEVPEEEGVQVRGWALR